MSVRNLIVSALLLCVPVALFANADTKADQNVTNVVANDDLNNAMNADHDSMNLDEGAADMHGHGGGGRRGGGWGGRGGWGRGGWGGGGWGWGGGYWGGYWPYYSWPYYGYGGYGLYY